ncbi:AT-rich interactive domain-containing protein 1B [Anopheles cruzii]|uniref:AT-rich interactive domain-containing protein 1B n=1 Tax=Anopheles cruzii TaxID=68878 RepID=UPI0022EC6F17|nr:AT-rich interactive domain-containing protein 1B [Anopheles cruzii]
MGLIEQLQEQGWYVTEPGLEKLLEGGGDKNGRLVNPDVKQVVKLALNTDLREFGGGSLGSLSSRSSAKTDSFTGTGVVQLVKLRNLGAPKVNEESKVAPRLLKLTITDGQTQYVALEHEHIPALSLNTPPGTKLLLRNGPIRIVQGVMLLSDKHLTVLGGQVTALVEKWELSRTMAKYAKGGRLQFSSSGPPPWIAFGQKIQQPAAANDKDFKSLPSKEKEESKENSEFNAQRNDAIAEATKLGTKKTFGGGSKQMVDANVQKIMDKGFSEEQATHALKLTRNNVQRALSNLQRIEDRKQHHAAQAQEAGGPLGGGGKLESGGFGKSGGRRGAGKREAAELELQSKPSGKVSLSDYLGDILQDSEPSVAPAGGSKKASKESTPNDIHHKGGGGGRGESNGRPEPGGNRGGARNSRQESSQNRNGIQSSAGGNRNANSDANHGGGGGVGGAGAVGGGKQHNQQRFENNISSSFANRNTSTAPGNSSSGNSRGQNHHQQQQGHHQGGSQRDGQGNFKQSDYAGSGSGRYRGGGNETQSSANHNHQASAGTSNNPSSSSREGGSSRRNDAKYNQQHQSSSSGAGYNAQQQQRQDGYNNNTTNSNSASGNTGSGGKYGKGQSHHSNYGPSEGRNHENRTGGGKGGAGGASSTANSHQHHAPAASNYGNGPKQSGSYGNQQQQQQQGGANAHYGQQGSSSNANNNYAGGTNNGTAKNSNKSGRYGGKDESNKYSAGPAPSNAAGTQHPPKKGKGSQSVQSQGHPGQSIAPFANTSSSSNSNANHKPASQTANNSNSSKINHLTDDVATMQILTGKPAGFATSNTGAATSSNVPAASSAPTKLGPLKTMSTHPPGTIVQHGPPPMAASPATTMPVPGPRVTPPGIPVAGPGPGSSSAAAGGPVVTGGVPKSFIQLPNGYSYNPYQIMGFQNKQSNEFALSVLKNHQQFEQMQASHLGASQVAAAPATVSPGVPLGATTPNNVLAPPMMSAAPATGPVASPGMAIAPVPAGTMAPMYLNWKIGDRCMAKYWEDGGFYTAEITNTTKNTFVVHFLEYGNFEEVLKTDCIPLAQATTPVAQAPMGLGFHAATTSHLAPPPQPAPVPGPPVQYAPHHPHHPHHHGHVPPHHAPPPMAAAGPGAYPAPMQDDGVVHQPSHYVSYKPGPHPPPIASPVPAPVPQSLPPTVAMNQYQPAPHHMHHTQQLPHQQQQQQQPQQHQQHMHHQPQQQQPQQAQAHMSQHQHHQSQMGGHGCQPQQQLQQQQQQQRGGTKFREQRPMYVPPAQRK